MVTRQRAHCELRHASRLMNWRHACAYVGHVVGWISCMRARAHAIGVRVRAP